MRQRAIPDEEADAGSDGGQSGLSTFRDTSTRFDISGEWVVKKAIMSRSARVLMEGFAREDGRHLDGCSRMYPALVAVVLQI